MPTSLIPGAQIGGPVGSATRFQIPSSTQRRDPWLWLLESGDQIAFWFDFNSQSIKCRRVSWNGSTWDLSAVVTIVPSLPGGILATFGNSQKIVLAYLDAQNAVRFARSQDEGDTWTLDVASG